MQLTEFLCGIMHHMDILKSQRDYECFCGSGVAFDFAASYILEHTTVKDISRLKIAVVSDRIVSGYYYNRFENQFILRGVKPVLVPVECQYSGKSISAVDSVYKYITDFDMGPGDWIIALGGGGILDVASFCAAVFCGGINILAVPTTLEAMIEGAVSGRAMLNSNGHKDEISTRVSYNAVICDPTFLSTVDSKYRSNGYASVIRYAILDDLSLLTDIVEPSNMREYLNRVYASRAKIEKIDIRLLTLGDEIAAAIEGYFRFMNYSSGEALALSLLAAVDDKRREPLSRIYKALGLPVMLQDVSGKMIYKTLCDRLDKYSKDFIEIVDFDAASGGRWVIRKVDLDAAKKIFAKRIALISKGFEDDKTI